MKFACLKSLVFILLFHVLCSVSFGQPPSISLTKEELSYLKSNNNIVFISQTNYPPFEFLTEDGVPDGITIELIHWLAAEIGFHPIFKNSTFLQAQQALLTGQANVLTSLFYSKNRDLSFSFTQPLFDVPASIFVLSERPDIIRLKDLAGKRIAIQKGDYAREFLTEAGLDFEVIPTPDFATATDAVINGDADALIGDEQIVLYYLFSHDLADKVKKVGAPLYTGLNCMGLENDNLVLRSILDKGIDYARSSGVLVKLTEKWLGIKVLRERDDWKQFWPYFVLPLVAIVFFILWNLHLRRAVEVKTRHLKDVQKKLRDEIFWRRLLIQESRDGIVIVDQNCQVLEANRNFVHMLGCEEDEVTNLHVWDWDFQYRKEQILELAKNIGTDGHQFSTRFHCKDGAVIDVEISSSGILYKGEKLIFCVCRDVTSRLQTEKLLKESEEKFRVAFQTNPDANILTRLENGVFVTVNEGWERLTGYSAQDVIGKSSLELATWKQPVERKKFIKMMNQKGYVENFELTFRGKYGQDICSLVSSRKITLGDEELLLTIIKDISEIKLAEAERLKLEKQLQIRSKMEAIGVLAGGMAHNFNNNLAIILGNLELAQKKSLQPNVSEYLKNARIALTYSRDLIRQIMIYSRNEPQERIPLRIADISAETFKLLKSTIPPAVNFTLDILPEANDLVVNANSSSIQEALINLCNNSIDAMQKKGALHIQLEAVESSAEQRLRHNLKTGKFAVITVSDSGCGIAENIRDKIFDPFFTTKEIGQGTGMGLSTVSGILETHHGFAEVMSEPQSGTAIRLYFPVCNQKVFVPADEPAMISGSGRILLVDDDAMLAQSGQNLMEDLGYEVTMTTSPRQALDLLNQDPSQFNLVITDYSMPEMTGTDLIKEIKDINSALPIILNTGLKDPLDGQSAKDLGIDALCMKPLDSCELSQIIHDCISTTS